MFSYYEIGIIYHRHFQKVKYNQNSSKIAFHILKLNLNWQICVLKIFDFQFKKMICLIFIFLRNLNVLPFPIDGLPKRPITYIETSVFTINSSFKRINTDVVLFFNLKLIWLWIFSKICLKFHFFLLVFY